LARLPFLSVLMARQGVYPRLLRTALQRRGPHQDVALEPPPSGAPLEAAENRLAGLFTEILDCWRYDRDAIDAILCDSAHLSQDKLKGYGSAFREQLYADLDLLQRTRRLHAGGTKCLQQLSWQYVLTRCQKGKEPERHRIFDFCDAFISACQETRCDL